MSSCLFLSLTTEMYSSGAAVKCSSLAVSHARFIENMSPRQAVEPGRGNREIQAENEEGCYRHGHRMPPLELLEKAAGSSLHRHRQIQRFTISMPPQHRRSCYHGYTIFRAHRHSRFATSRDVTDITRYVYFAAFCLPATPYAPFRFSLYAPFLSLISSYCAYADFTIRKARRYAIFSLSD